MDDLSERLEITYRGEKKELFMSFLRLNTCLRVIGDQEHLATLMVDPDIGENLIRAMVAPKAGIGALFEVELQDSDLSAEDYDKVLLWVQRHLTDFFMKRFQQAKQSAEELEPAIKALQSQLAGSKD